GDTSDASDTDDAGADDDDAAVVFPTSAASMDAVQLKHLVEALVFASDRPLTVQRLRQLTRVGDVRRLQQALAELSEDYGERGLVLQQVSGGYHFRTRTQFSAWVQQLIAGRPVRLSRAQLETLAIIAYRQPITRPEIDDIRGVDSTATLKLLIDRMLIRVLGKREEVGRPMLYGTTKEFLDFFSLGDLRELPTLREYSELTAESRKVMSDRLGISPDGDDGSGGGPDGNGSGSGGGGFDGGGFDGGGFTGGGSDGGGGADGGGGFAGGGLDSGGPAGGGLDSGGPAGGDLDGGGFDGGGLDSGGFDGGGFTSGGSDGGGGADGGGFDGGGFDGGGFTGGGSDGGRLDSGGFTRGGGLDGGGFAGRGDDSGAGGPVAASHDGGISDGEAPVNASDAGVSQALSAFWAASDAVDRSIAAEIEETDDDAPSDTWFDPSIGNALDDDPDAPELDEPIDASDERIGALGAPRAESNEGVEPVGAPDERGAMAGPPRGEPVGE
ncbi:MAG TPA: SMC-Scp complex subunit ScpB, partial [Thermomicrobiales bacterium]|nr:SMC-Scp complex subunit ScpB [Thermomicrobiales bacterium]